MMMGKRSLYKNHHHEEVIIPKLRLKVACVHVGCFPLFAGSVTGNFTPEEPGFLIADGSIMMFT
jgi:hypothetical protein